MYTHFMGFGWGLSSGTCHQFSAGLKMTPSEAKEPWTDANPSQCLGSLPQKKSIRERPQRWQVTLAEKPQLRSPGYTCTELMCLPKPTLPLLGVCSWNHALQSHLDLLSVRITQTHPAWPTLYKSVQVEGEAHIGPGSKVCPFCLVLIMGDNLGDRDFQQLSMWLGWHLCPKYTKHMDTVPTYPSKVKPGRYDHKFKAGLSYKVRSRSAGTR